MKCTKCSSDMTTKRENVPFTGRPDTVLVDVEVSRCAACGEYEVAIPALDALVQALAGEPAGHVEYSFVDGTWRRVR